MCRLFGFRSTILSQVHTSLMEADNALSNQSINNPDGWGVAYFVGQTPHVVKSDTSAITCDIFKKVSGVVSSQTVLAHIRKSTIGNHSILNTHPFQFGKWVFAHNGNIKNFKKYKGDLTSLVSPKLKRFILGDTDSELLFFIMLSAIEKITDLDNLNFSFKKLESTIRKCLEDIIHIIGDFSEEDDAGETETYLTFILSNGQHMLAHRGGKHLHYSTYKNKCGERDTCPSYAPFCEAAPTDGHINHLIFSSEPLSGENIWEPMKNGEIIGVGPDMKLKVSN